MIQYQFNKTSLQLLEKQLKVRVRALPTIKNKESALRMEVKRAKTEKERLDQYLEMRIVEFKPMEALWSEFDTSLLKIVDVEIFIKKIAGVRTPVLGEIKFEIGKFSLFEKPQWFLEGMTLLKELATIGIEREFYNQKMMLLEHARKKTTQKVNLFEKVQIPGYDDAIRKIKRFMEDEENLSKAAQKIVKSRYNKEEEDLS